MDESGEPLIGVAVVVKGTTIGTATDIDGSFVIEIPSESETLEISYIGYQTVLVDVDSDNNVVTATMLEDVNKLDEVVITGLAATVKRSNLANAVASISSKELTGITSQSTMDGALYGKFTGADIRANSGAPGGGYSIRLRGVTSVFLNQQPQYIVDGVYVDNSSLTLATNTVTAAAGGGNTASNQDDATNRIADLIPEDIESIEILKGASAAAIYGVGGAGGVVVIKTKAGNYNQDTRVNFSQTIGSTSALNLLGDRGWDRAKVADVFGEDEANRYDTNGTTDYEKLLYGEAAQQYITTLNVSGGSEKTKFFVGGTFRNLDGLVEGTGYEKSSFRANIGHKLTDKLTLNVASTYIKSAADRGLFNNSNANTTVGYAMAFTRPWDNLQADANGNFPANSRVGSNALETVNKITNRENVSRLFGSVNATYSVLQKDNQSLKVGVEVGLDDYTYKATGLFPQELSFYRDPSSLRGASIAGFTTNTNTNASAFLLHSYFTDSGLRFRTQAGVIQLNQDQNGVITVATGLNGSQTNIDQAENQSSNQTRLESHIKGIYFQEEVNYDDKIIATFGLRGDKSTNNGDPNEMFWNPKFSIAANIHNLAGLNSNGLSQLKLRAAYGQSARFAGFGDRFNALNATSIEGNAGLNTAPLRGNPEVSPETQKEFEFGVDLGFLENRVNLEATYYIKTIDDLLLRAQVPASSGFTTQVVNAGELENKGVELGLRAAIVRTGNFSWDTGLNWWKNSNTVKRLDIPAFNTGGFAAFLGQGRIEEGSSATQLIGTIDPSRCNGDDCTNVDPEGDGFMTFGDMEADFNLGWNNSMRFAGLELYWNLHWKNGGDGINLSTLLYDLGSVTWDYDDMTLDPNNELSNGDYRLAALGVHPGVYIEDAGYIRLREIGAFYDLGEVIKQADITVGVSGRNLWNSFDYNSYDPEVSNFGNNVLINSVEVTPYPSSKTVNFHINVSF